jgi:ribose transport system permease protein
VLFVTLSNQHVPLGLDILVVLAVGAVIGCANGTVVAKLEINPLIVTLATLSITEGIAYLVSDGVTIPLNSAGAAFLANPIPGNVPLFVPLTVVVAIVTALVLSFTTVGRRVYGVGGNRTAAWLAGIRVDLVTIGTFATCSVLAAVAGIMVASELVAGSGTVESTAALDSIAAVVIGGAALTGGEGSVTGSLLGVLIIATIGNGLELLHISAFYQQIATGCLLLAAVAAQRVRKIAVGRVRTGGTESELGTGSPAPVDPDREAFGPHPDVGTKTEA